MVVGAVDEARLAGSTILGRPRARFGTGSATGFGEARMTFLSAVTLEALRLCPLGKENWCEKGNKRGIWIGAACEVKNQDVVKRGRARRQQNPIANEEQNTDGLPVSASSVAAARDLLVTRAISRRSARGQ